MVNKKQIRKIAKLYAVSLIENAIGSGACSDLLSEDELQILSDELDKISRRISKTYGYLGYGSLDVIIEEVVNKQK